MASRSFLAELKRRNVLRAATLYAAGAWLLVQVVTQVGPVFDLPPQTQRWIIVAAAIGFPFAMALSWFYELTPEGFKPESEVEESQSIRYSTGRKLDFWIIGVLSIAVVLLLANTFLLHRDAAVVAAHATPGKSIAVLPFENLSDDKANAYFANGIQDMILTRLSGIGELKVISRTSTEKYASHPGNLKDIARQLGVTSILEGSVQKSGNQVLINVQLIDAASDRQLWAEAYPRTLDNVFSVEGDVAHEVAEALKARLTPVEAAAVAKLPTSNAAAYDAFLQAEELARHAGATRDEQDSLAAETAYRKAIALDPGFALADAKLAIARLRRHWQVLPLADSEMAEAKAMIDQALRLAPDLPEAHLAMGYYWYWGRRDFEPAAAEFQHALKLAPNNVSAMAALGYLTRRTGHFADSLDYLSRALRNSPRDAGLMGEYGTDLMFLRRYDEADRQFKLAHAIDPDELTAAYGLIYTRLFGFGDPAGARAARPRKDQWRFVGKSAAGVELGITVGPWTYPDLIDRRYDDALHDWDNAPTGIEEVHLESRVARATIQVIAGRKTQVQDECHALEPLLQSGVASHPDSPLPLGRLAWIEVCLGHDADAIAAARKAVTVRPVDKDAFSGVYVLSGLAQIDAQAGAHDEALQLIHRLLAMPAGSVMSVQRLKLDPVFDPLRADPRFAALVKDAETSAKAASTP